MRRDFELYLWDVMDAISEIQSFVADMTFDQYLESRMAQRAVERDFGIIGEALKQADQNFPGKLDSLSGLSNAARFRDRLAHGYFSIRQEIIWDVVKEDLAPLRSAIKKLLDAPENEVGA